jgi:hypothetical protein
MCEERPVRGRECIRCKKMFECKGKPKSSTLCVNFEERKDGREKNVCKNNSAI